EESDPRRLGGAVDEEGVGTLSSDEDRRRENAVAVGVAGEVDQKLPAVSEVGIEERRDGLENTVVPPGILEQHGLTVVQDVVRRLDAAAERAPNVAILPRVPTKQV